MIELVVQVLGFLLGAYILIMMLLAAIAYWPYTLFILGIILVNVFTLWSEILLFCISICLLTFSHYQENTLTLKIFMSEIIINSVIMVVAVVVFSLIVNAIFGNIGGGGACSRATPGGC